MKVKDVIKDLGSTTLVQIYAPSLFEGDYKECFNKAYAVGLLLDVDYIDILGKYLGKDVDHVEYGHYYTTNDMVASCNIYLKNVLRFQVNDVDEEKPDMNAIIYADLEKKWDIFRKQAKIDDDFKVKAWLVSLFLHMLSNGELVEMEDKDLS
jgi:hypothetical protein